MHSGYGRVGAFMSGRFNQAYGIEYTKDSSRVPPRHDCGANDYVNFLAV